MAHGELQAGCATADITPAPGIHMGGYWGRWCGAVDVHDALEAKVLVFAQGGQKAGLVGLDLVALEAATVERIRRRIQEEVGIAAEAIMICCSHTHAGPLTIPFRGMGEVDPLYLQKVEDVVVQLVIRASDSLQGVQLAYRKVPVQVGFNRRWGHQKNGSDGAVAPYAHVVRIDGGEGQLATLFSHACHPVVLGSANHRISGDFAGAASRYIETRTQKPALFINGACGDINPRLTNGDFAAVEEIGAELGQAVMGGLDTAEALDAAGFHYRRETVRLPFLDPPSTARLQFDQLLLQAKMWMKKRTKDGGDLWKLRVPQAYLDWTRAMLSMARSGDGDGFQAFEIQGLRIGSLILLGMEGEIFVRYQLDLEMLAPRHVTMLCGFANGCIGYVPTADEYVHGNYEVETAYKVYPSVQMIAPESEALIRGKAEAVLAELS
jgi:neutral ceramidase